MMNKHFFMAVLTAAVMVAVSPAGAQDSPDRDRLQAVLVDSFGKTAGTAIIRRAPKGILLRIEATGLSQGWHGLHFHGTGDCSDHLDHFAKSGGHAANAGQQHGYFNPAGPHSGDLPNIWAALDGTARAEFYTEGMNFEGLQDEDGSALMIHAGPDDYTSQPSGESGERSACGVVKALE